MSQSGGYRGPLEQIGPCQWRIPKSYRADMRVDGIIFADETLIEQIHKDQGPEQVANVATLPGIQKASLAMPDIHWGYGFCIGGVAATDPEEGGVISPGGVGYDINCGVRLLRTNLDLGRREGPDQATGQPALPRHPHRRRPERPLRVRQARAHRLMEQGLGLRRRARAGEPARPVEYTEAGGCLDGADPARVSDRAIKRGYDQCGTLGSGNHFLEVQVVDRILDAGGRRGDGPARGAGHRVDPFGLARPGLPGMRRLPGARSRTPRSSTASSCRTGSLPAPRCAARKASRTWAPCARPPTMPGATASS